MNLWAFGTLLLLCRSASGDAKWVLTSPDKSVSLEIKQDSDGVLTYTIASYTEAGVAEVVVLPSRLKLSVKVNGDRIVPFETFTCEKASEDTITDDYEALHGKRRYVRGRAKQLTLRCYCPNGYAYAANLIARAYDKEGVALRLLFPPWTGELSNTQLELATETTEFVLPKDGKQGTAWMHAYDRSTWVSPAYETIFREVEIGSTSPYPQGWAFPMLFHTANRWILITEAGMEGDYHGSHLERDAEHGRYRLRQPEQDEAFGAFPAASGGMSNEKHHWGTPWRVFVVGPSPATIFESNLVHLVSTPSLVPDAAEWVRPGRASWSWWSDHDSPRHFDDLKRFVDLAADMGWEYSLVDANWNKMKGGSLEELAQYARDKKVGLFAWYNSGGKNNPVGEEPRDRLSDAAGRATEMQRLRAMGIVGMKVDFFHTDRMGMMQYYVDILRDAALHRLMVLFHGCTLPRGWERTWPHLMTMEGVRGAEQYTAGPDARFDTEAPLHNTILPFTRNVVGGMDYTPVTFSDSAAAHRTSNPHELALAVVFESGVLHLADSVTSYRSTPEMVRTLLRAVPAAWDESRYVSGAPGSAVFVARRVGQRWFLAGISGLDVPHDTTVALAFLEEGRTYSAQIVRDTADNSRDFACETSAFPNNMRQFSARLLPRGGVLVMFDPTDDAAVVETVESANAKLGDTVGTSGRRTLPPLSPTRAYGPLGILAVLCVVAALIEFVRRRGRQKDPTDVL